MNHEVWNTEREIHFSPGHTTELSAMRIKARQPPRPRPWSLGRSVRSRSCHDKWPFTAALSFPLLSFRSFFAPLSLPSDCGEMKPYRVPVSASAKISAPISLSFLPRPPLHSLIWRREWPLTAPGPAPLSPCPSFPSLNVTLQLQPIWFLSFVVKVTGLLFLLP